MLLGISQDVSTGLILVGAALLFLSFLLPRMAMKRRAASLGGDSPISRERAKEVEKSLDEVFLRLQEFSRETLAKLDTRVRMLNQLVIDADERIKRIEQLRETKEGPGAASGPPSDPPPARLPPNPIHDRIYRLLDEGSSISEIARKVGLPIGEVELIAGLRGLPQGGG